MEMSVRRVDQLPGAFQQYQGSIGDALRRGLSVGCAGLGDMLRFHMGWGDTRGNRIDRQGGKGLRPTLCLIACEATGGDVRIAMPAAVALEYVHNFSLIHDDIQDGDEARHGRPTLYWQWGMPRALVAGNFLRVIADKTVQELVDSGLEERAALDVASALTSAYLEMIEGQYMDLEFEGRGDVSIQQYLEMISKKTGALFRCSVDLGAMIGSRDHETRSAFHEFGRALGFLFQIRDDVLGVWGESEQTGKPVYSDIRRKKNSFPVVHAMTFSRNGDAKTLQSIYGQSDDEISDRDLAVVLEILGRTDTRSSAQQVAAGYRDQALEAIAAVELSPETREGLEHLADFLLVREH